MKILFLVFASIFVCARGNPLLDYDFGDACKSSDKSCWSSKFADALPTILKVVGNPVCLPKMVIPSGKGVLHWNIQLEDTKIEQLEHATLHNITLDLQGGTAALELTVKELKISSKYDINGRVLVLPVLGNGVTTVVLKNASVIIFVTFCPTSENIDVTSIKLVFQYKDVNMDFSNFFFERKNKILTRQYNVIINANRRAIMNDLLLVILPAIESSLLPLAKVLLAPISWKSICISD